MKFLLDRITGNHALMLKVFLYLTDKIVESTENELDDRIFEHLENILGVIDFDGLEGEQIEAD